MPAAPSLQAIGIEYISSLAGIHVVRSTSRDQVKGAFGAIDPTFAGNGSPEGHQSMRVELRELL